MFDLELLYLILCSIGVSDVRKSLYYLSLPCVLPIPPGGLHLAVAIVGAAKEKTNFSISLLPPYDNIPLLSNSLKCQVFVESGGRRTKAVIFLPALGNQV